MRADLSPQAGWGESKTRLLTMRDELNPEQLRIARLDFFGHLLDAGRIFLHQLDVGYLPPARLRLHLRMHRILRGEIDEELLGFAGVQPGLEQSCGLGMRPGGEAARLPRNGRRVLG